MGDPDAFPAHLKKEFLSQISSLFNLETLDLSSNKLEAYMMPDLKNLTSLKLIGLGYNDFFRGASCNDTAQWCCPFDGTNRSLHGNVRLQFYQTDSKLENSVSFQNVTQNLCNMSCVSLDLSIGDYQCLPPNACS